MLCLCYIISFIFLIRLNVDLLIIVGLVFGMVNIIVMLLVRVVVVLDEKFFLWVVLGLCMCICMLIILGRWIICLDDM